LAGSRGLKVRQKTKQYAPFRRGGDKKAAGTT